LIKEYLINENDYLESSNLNYDKYHVLDTEMLFEFLETTQKKTMQELKNIYGPEYKQKIVKR